MKKLISLLMALLMLLSCTVALAESATMDRYTADFSISFDEEALISLLGLEQNGIDQGLMDILTPLLNNLGGRIIAAPEGNELAVTLNGASLFTMGVYQNDGSVSILSDLFPNYALEMPYEQTAVTVSDEELTAAITSLLTAVTMKMQAYVTGTETGAYEFEGVTFDTKSTLEMTTKEMGDLISDVGSALLADETVAKLLSSMGEAANLNEMAAGLQAMKEQMAEDTEGGFVLYSYARSGSTDVYVTGEAKIGDAASAVTLSYIGNTVKMQLLAGEDVFINQDQMLKAAKQCSGDAMLFQCAYTPGATEYDMDLQLDLYAGMYIGMHVKTGKMPMIGYALNADITLAPGGDPLLSIAGLIIPSAQLSLRDTLSPANTISLDAAMLNDTSEEAQLAMYNLGNDIASFGLNTLLANAAMAMPQEVSALITYMMAPPETTDSYTFDGVTD